MLPGSSLSASVPYTRSCRRHLLPSAEQQWYIAVFDTGPLNDLAYDQALCSALLVDYHRTSR
jgi:hypothetical protein